MKILKSSEGSEVLIYSAAKEMPISRYNEFQKYILIASGIGSSIEDIDAHYGRIVSFIANDDKESAIKEAENNRHALISALSAINYNSLAFACMVKKIENVDCDDITDEGLERTLQLLSGMEITQEVIELSVEELKKK